MLYDDFAGNDAIQMTELIIIILLLGILAINVLFALSLIGCLWGGLSGAPYVPTKRSVAEQMIRLAEIEPDMKVFDLGCGDGRLVFMAEKKGAVAIGVEISLPVYIWAKLLQKIRKHKGTIVHGSMWNADVKDADVIFTYLFPKMMDRFQQEMFPQLKNGCKVITHGFALKGREPDIFWKPKTGKRGRIFVYIKK